jgi:hypothetical protein
MPDFSAVQKRAFQYWFVDGLAELAAGLVSLFLAVLLGVWQVVFMWRWSLPVILAAGLVVSFGLRLIVQRIKERTTYLQTGYAAPVSGLESKRSVAITVAFTLVLLGLNYYLSSQGWLWSPGLVGAAFALAFAWTGALTSLRRFYYLAGLSVCVGVALAVLGLDYFQGGGILAAIVGLILLVQGYQVRRAYLRQNAPHHA